MLWKNDQVSRVETEKIIEIAGDCLSLAGDYVELGCYKGDTSLLLAEVLQETDKKLWLYDSFEGLPPKTEADSSELGRDFVAGALAVSKREVKARFLRAGLRVPVIKKAWFEELAETDLPDKIAWAFIDADLYASIRVGLKLVENKMVAGGVILVHDYVNPALPGVAKAVDEWAEQKHKEIIVFQSLAIIRI
ncbi:class I SAM-dependent methyltransferase [Candidatus Saccharibacteria bacterium]|nr:class I SAM-dependent methyltransferase [Candidatus Saccharibacteria bacterium]